LTCAPLFAQEIASPNESREVVVPNDDISAAVASYTIFSNLDSAPDDRYNSDAFFAEPVAGRQALFGQTEHWTAVRFIPKVDVQASVLTAAVGYISGTKLVNLGIYSNNEITNSVGDLLPGGQGSTRQIPDVDECCQLARVTLAGEGVTLTAGTIYWLVASPDNVNAPDFSGGWHISNLAHYAPLTPPFLWGMYTGRWPAAQICGVRVRALSALAPANLEDTPAETSASAGNVTIFTNLGHASTGPYAAGDGTIVSGNSVPFQPEVWQALPFMPRVAAHAKTLAAAIGYNSGTKLVNLGIYSDSGGTVGTLLPGGQASTSEIPDFGVCCGLTQVSLPGAGVALTAGTQYWLVASPDNVNAPDFWGFWQHSNLAVGAYQEPEFFINWTSFSAQLFAAEIRGTSP
jgi:hypothetical protein